MVALARGEGYRGAQYGAIELKAVYQRYWIVALGIAIAIHLVLIGSYYLMDIMRAGDPPMIKARLIRNHWDPGPPPPITNASAAPPISVSSPAAKLAVGAPVPVPDASVSAEQTLATQIQVGQQTSRFGDATGAGDFGVDPEFKIDEEAPPEEFTPVQKEPAVVKKVEPRYPELAVRGGLEGKVWVKIWVDKEGKAKQVVVLKSDAEIFNEPAIEAAKQFVFTPAYMNNGPVSVWVSVPFKFKLADKK